MIMKYLSKFVLEVLPSVAATIIGAYIVNHYITGKPDVPVAAAVSTADAKVTDPRATESESKTKAETKAETKAADAKDAASEIKGSEAASDTVSASDPTPIRKIAIDRPGAGEKPTETASLPAEPRRHPAPPARDKAVAKTTAPTVAAASIAPPAEASSPQEERQQERRDANDLARAAIERLRNAGEPSRASEAPRVQESARESNRAISAPPLQPLPPPIMVSTPSAESYSPNPPGQPQQRRADDPRRPIPPADIPTGASPMDLHADATTTGSVPSSSSPSVADDMLSSVKSVFHAVLPR